jgi:hypothetical protein
MADFKQQLVQIQKKRKEKDQLETKLYYHKLDLFKLASREKKLENKDIVTSREDYRKIAEARTNIETLERNLNALIARIARSDSNAETERLNSEKEKLSEQIESSRNTLLQFVEPSDREIDEIKKKRSSIATKHKNTEDEIKAVRTEYNRLIDGFFNEYTIEELTEGKNDNLPVLLFPVKIEVKFHQTTTNSKELWVRIYPDDIAITTHEDELTDEEIKKGQVYWKNIWSAGNSEEDKKGAWKVLVNTYGAPRSAWVAKSTKPINWDSLSTGSSLDLLTFPAFQHVKPDSWSQAPKSRILPDRFVVTGLYQGKMVKLGTGNQIPDPLICGPDPLDAINSFEQKDGDIKLGNDFSWATDFNKAIELGMGLKITLEEPYASKGFEKLYVLGLKWTADNTESKEIVENLVKEHHYSPTGFSLIKQGTATNNTDDEDSGYSENDIFSSLSYYVEGEKTQFNRETEFYKITDGQRLADLLGINMEYLQNIQNSGQYDYAESVAMNRALYPGTLGYFLETMMEPVFSDDGIKFIRNFFTDYVTGRGPLSAIRVGDQPYGILPTSDFSKWKWNQKLENSLDQMYSTLKYFSDIWKIFLSHVSYIGQNGNPSQILLDILGLNPNSVSLYQRVGYSTDYLKNLDEFKSGGKYYDEALTAAFSAFYFMMDLKYMGYDPIDKNGKEKKTPHFLEIIYKHYQTQLDGKNIIDGNPLSETEYIKTYKDKLNYIHWLVNATKIDDLEKQDFGQDIAAPNYLLYLMLRNALLLQLHDSTGLFYIINGIPLTRYKRAVDFCNIKTLEEPTKWELMKANVNLVQPGAPANLAVADHLLANIAVNPYNEENVKLKEVKDALDILAGLPTARLERAFIEHLDCLNYRLDAWQTAIFNYRLLKNRNLLDQKNRNAQPGLYIGAFGWLENIVPPSTQKKTIPDAQLPEKLRNKDDSLVFDDPLDGGYVHTPSLNHAYGAALLRNAYLTHADKSEKELMTVNLSSSRIRNAIGLIEGIRNGQPLEVLLGYQFERAMHDMTSDNPILKLDAYILDFRLKFPIKKQPIPQTGTNSSEEASEEYSVVDGLTLAETDKAYPFGISSLSGASSEVKDAVLTIQDQLKNSIDAVKDVLTSESTYQLALGNFERAGASIKAISDSAIPSDIDGIKSQRGNEITFTNKVIVQFETNINIALPENNLWNISPLSPRACMEPGINKWLAGIIGDPEKIRCTVHHMIDENTASSAIEYSLKDLMLQPIDFIYMLGNELQGGATEIEQIIINKYRRDSLVVDKLLIKINFSSATTTTSDIITFTEIFPLAVYMKKLITGSTSIDAEDLQSSSKDKPADESNPKGLDHAELLSRLTIVKSLFDTAQGEFETAKTNFDITADETNANALRDALIKITAFGIVNALPASQYGINSTMEQLLDKQTVSIQKKLAEISTAYTTKISTANAETNIALKTDALISAVKLLLGEGFNALPCFYLNNSVDMQNAYNDRETILNHAKNVLNIRMPIENWIHGVTKVRPKVGLLENIRLLADALDRDEIKLEAVQLPYKANDTWLAVELPALEEGKERGILHDTHSVVVHQPKNFSPFTRQCGLLIDEWVEVIPEEKSVTGISIHFNQPNAEPPQALLLAITPEETGKWEWEDLLSTLDDTLLRSKLRMIEPDVVDKTKFGILLPALISEFSTSKNTISLDYSFMVAKVIEAVKLKFPAYGI